jgi:hypothetical protein
LVFLIALLTDNRVEPDINIVFVADAVKIVFKVDNFQSRRQRKVAGHMEHIRSRNGIIIHVGGYVFNADSPQLE